MSTEHSNWPKIWKGECGKYEWKWKRGGRNYEKEKSGYLIYARDERPTKKVSVELLHMKK